MLKLYPPTLPTLQATGTTVKRTSERVRLFYFRARQPSVLLSVVYAHESVFEGWEASLPPQAQVLKAQELMAANWEAWRRTLGPRLPPPTVQCAPAQEACECV